MDSSITITEAGPDSSETALRLLERFFREEGFSAPVQRMRTSLRTMMTAPGSAVYLAWRGNKAVGVATVTTSVGIEYGLSAEIEDLYVLPQEQGCGVASALIEAACAWCCQKGVAVVLATVTAEGEAEHKLLDFYRRRGFANTGRVILERPLADG